MSGLPGVLALLLHAALVLAAAPLLAGAIRLARARLLGRPGPPVLQGWRDLLRLLRKRPVLAENASWLFAAVPGVCAAAMLAAALLVPSFALGMTTAPLSDLLVVLGLLALMRCALALAGLDAGTSLGGMGASRIAGLAAFAEPALLLVALVVLLLAGTTNLDAAAGLLRDGAPGPADSASGRVPLALAMAAAGAALAGTVRRPSEDPAAQESLAMAEEAVLLEYSGRHLALIEYAASLRLLVCLNLVACLFLPAGVAPAGAGPPGWAVGLLAWAAKLAVLAAALAGLEAGAARMRAAGMPDLLGLALLLALLAVVLLFSGQGVV